MVANRLGFLLKSTHPMPSLAVALFATLFAVGIGLETQRVALVGLAVLLQQFSVGLSNDWLDHKRDRAAGRTDKPVARGSLGVSLVRNSLLRQVSWRSSSRFCSAGRALVGWYLC